MGDIILNLCKVLESLFPPSREAVRKGLMKLNYSTEEIEGYFIPVMLLRNKIVSGHVFLSLFAREELNTLHSYTEGLEGKFSDLLKRLFSKLEAHEIVINEYEVSSEDREAKNIISTIERTLEGLK